MATGSLSTSSPKILQYHIDDHDRISKLPHVLLQMIISKLSTKEAVRTSILSSRWVDVWKCMSHLVLDTREVLDATTEEHKHLYRLSVRLARSMTNVINNHRGHVESCVVHHYVSQLKNGTLQNWIHSLTSLKNKKDLTLINYIPATRRYNETNFLSLHLDTFSHHSLSPHAFSKCKNLKTLKLTNIFISQPSALSVFLSASSSLEVIVLNVNFLTPHGVLKIENNSLKFLQLSFPYEIDRMEVYATCLNVLDIEIRFINAMRDNFILVAPNIKVNKNVWLDHGDCPHLYYNVSSNLAQEEKNIWHELLGSKFDDMTWSGCLSVSVDITNPKEMEILKEVLLRFWTKLVMELEIFFKKKKSPREKGETSTSDITHEKPFPKAGLCFNHVRLYNFDGSKEEEFAFVLHFFVSSDKEVNAGASVAKLMELPKCKKHLKIECF
ncbi:hypothetical protein Bca52824_024172 [Brassica carinata]|uniref:F-box domain-containing protein n=1 Tax=Brassica carinata TaxID=52824 RepID=A0A8X7VKL2_BRACI|nr:hypothetical protein Bca52824_024172 [Brassica carinata]